MLYNIPFCNKARPDVSFFKLCSRVLPIIVIFTRAPLESPHNNCCAPLFKTSKRPWSRTKGRWL